MTGTPAKSSESSRTRRHFAGYLLEKMLGKGGMAEVFRARKTGPHGVQMSVALKRVLPQYADSADRIDRFLEEMKIAAQLQHANVVKVLDFGEAEGRYFLTLELVEGLDVRSLCGALAEKAKKSGPRYPGQERGLLPPAVAALIGIETAKGLAYMHGQKLYENGQTGVIHRDIDPSNLMVDIHGEVRVNDVGIAKSLKGDQNVLSATEHAYGKPLYAPPEQCTGGPIDATADYYALGITLFQIVTGRHPYDDPMHPNENPFAKVARAANHDRKPIAELAPEMPPSMQALLEKIIQPNRHARPHAPEIIEALKRAAKEAVAGLDKDGRPYDLHDIQEWTAQLVKSVHGGPRTAVEMEGYRPDQDDDGPEEGLAAPDVSKSHKRLVSEPGTKLDRPAAQPDVTVSNRTAPLPTGATAPMGHQPTTPLAGASDHAVAPPNVAGQPAHASPQRPWLIAALALSTAFLFALLAGIAGFAFGGQGTEQDPAPQTEGTTPATPPPETVTSYTPTETPAAGGNLPQGAAAASTEQPSPPAESPESPPVAETTEDTEPEAQTAEPGRLTIVAIPAGPILLDNRRIAGRNETRTTVSVSAGRHTVVAGTGSERTRCTINIRPGRHQTLEIDELERRCR